MEILKTILKINPQAKVVVRGGDINTCEIEWLDGTTPISKTEIATMIPVVEQEIATQELNKESNKQSALNKLKALGLNDAEIKAIIGV
jgi:uncharacterized beta-barrel protein YwiB (DUF1934 family)